MLGTEFFEPRLFCPLNYSISRIKGEEYSIITITNPSRRDAYVYCNSSQK